MKFALFCAVFAFASANAADSLTVSADRAAAAKCDFPSPPFGGRVTFLPGDGSVLRSSPLSFTAAQALYQQCEAALAQAEATADSVTFDATSGEVTPGRGFLTQLQTPDGTLAGKWAEVAIDGITANSCISDGVAYVHPAITTAGGRHIIEAQQYLQGDDRFKQKAECWIAFAKAMASDKRVYVDLVSGTVAPSHHDTPANILTVPANQVARAKCESSPLHLNFWPGNGTILQSVTKVTNTAASALKEQCEAALAQAEATADTVTFDAISGEVRPSGGFLSQLQTPEGMLAGNWAKIAVTAPNANSCIVEGILYPKIIVTTASGRIIEAQNKQTAAEAGKLKTACDIAVVQAASGSKQIYFDFISGRAASAP